MSSKKKNNITKNQVQKALKIIPHPKAVNPSRTKTGKVPQGRTIITNDNYLADGKRTGSTAEHPAIVIEASEKNELVIVPTSSQAGKNRTRLPNYQQGQTYYKHFIEIEDDEGNPIMINEKFRENHPNMDVSSKDVAEIIDKVLNHSKPSSDNRNKLDKFRKRK